MPAQHTRITVGLRISSRAKALANRGVEAAYELAEEMAELAADYARANVEPGVGPASHSYNADSWGHQWPHEDTGDLGDSVQIADQHQGFLGVASVYTDKEYGAWLNVGFHSPAGNFFRYPWLDQAFARAAAELAPDLPARLFRKLSEPYSTRMVASHEDISKFIRKEELAHFYYTEES